MRVAKYVDELLEAGCVRVAPKNVGMMAVRVGASSNLAGEHRGPLRTELLVGS